MEGVDREEHKSLIDVEVNDGGFYLKGWNILVQPIKVEEKTKGGVLLPDKFKEDMAYLNNICRVIQLGSLAYTQEGFKGEQWCQEGDYVLIPRNVGTKLQLRGVPVTIVACQHVLAAVDDPSILDTSLGFTFT